MKLPIDRITIAHLHDDIYAVEFERYYAVKRYETNRERVLTIEEFIVENGWHMTDIYFGSHCLSVSFYND